MKKQFYVVNAGRFGSTSRATHIMQSSSPSTPNPRSPEGVHAQPCRRPRGGLSDLSSLHYPAVGRSGAIYISSLIGITCLRMSDEP
jgi:hypothetical protein